MSMDNTNITNGKSAACSVSEFVQILRKANMNGADRLFGGHLITWMDEVAAVSARRYAEGPVTTACIENLVVDAAWRKDKEAVYHAVCMDPLTSAVCSLEEIHRMTEELFEVNRDFLGDYR